MYQEEIQVGAALGHATHVRAWEGSSPPQSRGCAPPPS